MKDLMITVVLVIFASMFVVYFGAEYIGAHKKERDTKCQRIEVITIIFIGIILACCLGLIGYIHRLGIT